MVLRIDPEPLIVPGEHNQTDPSIDDGPLIASGSSDAEDSEWAGLRYGSLGFVMDHEVRVMLSEADARMLSVLAQRSNRSRPDIMRAALRRLGERLTGEYSAYLRDCDGR